MVSAGSPKADRRMALREISTLVISGYSFGAKAVNTMITDWIYAGGRGERRIAVAHEDSESLREGSRGAMELCAKLERP
jgi:hypothetical protein